MRIVFMGTPDFAATIFEHVHVWSQTHEDVSFVAAYCQPDRPSGRGQTLASPPVKRMAEHLSVPIIQVLNFHEEADYEALKALAPDILLVAAYGLLLPQRVLDIPTIGSFNVHASLLPRYRGAAPIQRAIMNSDTTTGITIMRMEAGLDTGPMLLQRALVIGADESAGDIHDELALLGADLMIELLQAVLLKRMPASIAQNNDLATHAPKLTKAEGLIDWAQNTSQVHAQVRGVTPWPGAQTFLHLQGRDPLAVTFGVGRCLSLSANSTLQAVETASAGTVLGLHDACLAIRTLDGVYLIPELCPAGKKTMPADALSRGYGCVGVARICRDV